MSDETEDRRRRCRSCRALIEMIRGPADSFIPVQKVRTVYTLESAMPGMEDAVPKQLRMLQQDRGKGQPPLYVSHFETCPDASSHSRG